MERSPAGEVLWTLRAEALLEMTGAEGLSPELKLGSLWRVAGEGRGLPYARSAMRVKPASRRVRKSVVFIVRGLVCQCAEENIFG